MTNMSFPMLWIVLIGLPSPLLSGGKETAEKTAEEQLTTQFKVLYFMDEQESKNLHIRDLSFGGKEFIHPNDPNQIVRIYKLPKRQEESKMLKEQEIFELLMSKEKELDNNVPLTQKLNRMLSFQFDDKRCYSFEMERFRGDLVTGFFEDSELRESLLDFEKRLELYETLAFAFQQFSALNIKHCNLEIRRVLYKKQLDDFSTRPLPAQDCSFTFVLSDFKYAKPTTSPCDEGMPSFWDHEDALGKIPSSSKCKHKIEIFGLGMLILKIETFALMTKGDHRSKNRSNELQQAFASMSTAPSDLETYFGNATPIQKESNYEIMNEIIESLDFWNRGVSDNSKISFSAASLLQDLEYIAQANAVVFEHHELSDHPSLAENEVVKGKVAANYAAFNSMLMKMLMSNDYINGRLNQAEVYATLEKVRVGYSANIQALARNRLLLV